MRRSLVWVALIALPSSLSAPPAIAATPSTAPLLATVEQLILPSTIPSSGQVIQLATDGEHSCALTAVGAVKCWGWNGDGELGDGTEVQRNTPVQVVGLTSGVRAIAVGSSHSCAITGSGAVECWGADYDGLLGDGGTGGDRTTPVQVSGLSSGVMAIASGDEHTCALTSGGAVLCWGYNGWVGLGDGSSDDNSRNTPVQVSGLTSGVTAIAAGDEHSCALTSGGAVLCWGYNNNGQLGDGTKTDRLEPVPVKGLLSGVRSIAAGGSNTCAVTSRGSAKCWGWNGYGELGNGKHGRDRRSGDTGGVYRDSTNSSSVPVQVKGLTRSVQIVAVGGTHSCAIAKNGALKCWGYNGYGELGNGKSGRTKSDWDGGTYRDATNSHTVPVAVTGLVSGTRVLSAGENVTCAVTRSRATRCWGVNWYGQLGDGTTKERHTPRGVKTLS